MSELLTPLLGKSYDGLVQVAELPRRGMITLRGDISTATMRNVTTGLTGTAMPGRGRVELAGDGMLAWMSPDELLLVLPADRVPRALERIAKDLASAHHLALDVSDARAMIRVSGADAAVRDTLAKLAPVDFSAKAFPAGSFRRSRLAQVPAAFWCAGAGDFGLICFRSVAEYAFSALSNAADPAGTVGHYA
ncbi:sarcosine oxidase subunit gamma family protein [Pseudooceanicola sp.]|uniref:sarcosine oxidase subunit gamma n=1 Tax=Pseudooceanicola sp. TaxID=1914328 RepID=UPI002603E163|nr:sarcosine oxidase subunit gamma family protein [Pseudooceanicola sp.]MDF1856080.1 sarcosine oxidase subunit gamma family protein [Pseudooceanicola sp.]